MERQESTYVEYSNIIASLVLCFHFINGVVGIEGISVINISVIIGLQVVLWFKTKVLLNKWSLILIFYILISFFVSFLRVPDTSYTITYLIYFLVFNIISLIVGTQSINVEKVVHITLYIGIFGLPMFLLRGFEGLNSGDTMGISYSILPIFFSSIIALLNYRKLRLSAIVCFGLSLYFFIAVAPRGIWITIILFILFVLLFKIAQSRSTFKQNFVKIILLSLISYLVWLCIENFYEIIRWMDTFLVSKLNVSVSALRKIMYYFNKGDLLNGRSELWNIAYDCISENFVFGKGIGYYECATGGTYPHNIFLQVMCEQGVFFGIPLILLLIKALKHLFSTHSKIRYDYYGYLVMVICSGLVMLFYSSSYWRWVPFWYCVGYMLSWNFKHFSRNEKERN